MTLRDIEAADLPLLLALNNQSAAEVNALTVDALARLVAVAASAPFIGDGDRLSGFLVAFDESSPAQGLLSRQGAAEPAVDRARLRANAPRSARRRARSQAVGGADTLAVRMSRSALAIGAVLNGVLVNQFPYLGSIVDNTAPLRWGARSNGQECFAGNLDELAIYGTALPDARITAHYQAGIGN